MDAESDSSFDPLSSIRGKPVRLKCSRNRRPMMVFNLAVSTMPSSFQVDFLMQFSRYELSALLPPADGLYYWV